MLYAALQMTHENINSFTLATTPKELLDRMGVFYEMTLANDEIVWKPGKHVRFETGTTRVIILVQE